MASKDNLHDTKNQKHEQSGDHFNDDGVKSNHGKVIDTNEIILQEVFSQIFVNSSVIQINGGRFSGKITFLMEIISQSLAKSNENEILFIDCSNKLDLVMLEKICRKYMSDAEGGRKKILHALRRLKILRIRSCKEFYDFLKCFESIFSLCPKISLIMIDELMFYNFDALNFGMTKPKFFESYIKFLQQTAKTYEKPVVFTLSNCIANMDSERKGRKLYQHVHKKLCRESLPSGKMMIKTLPSSFDTMRNDHFSSSKFRASADATITMKCLSKDNYRMHIQKADNQLECDIYFKIQTEGIEWI